MTASTTTPGRATSRRPVCFPGRQAVTERGSFSLRSTCRRSFATRVNSFARVALVLYSLRSERTAKCARAVSLPARLRRWKSLISAASAAGCMKLVMPSRLKSRIRCRASWSCRAAVTGGGGGISANTGSAAVSWRRPLGSPFGIVVDPAARGIGRAGRDAGELAAPFELTSVVWPVTAAVMTIGRDVASASSIDLCGAVPAGLRNCM